MAKTYDDYQQTDVQKARENGEEIIERVAKAMDRTEILQDVRRRVTAFVKAYEADVLIEVEHIAKVREAEGYDPASRVARVADNMEQDIQALAGPPGKKLLLDDLKILLDQFPQKDI